MISLPLLSPDEFIKQSQTINIFRYDDLAAFRQKYSIENFIINDDSFACLGDFFKKENKSNLFCLAAYFNAIQIGEFLFLNGASPNSVDEFNRAPIHYAGAAGSLDFIRLLEYQQADINSTDSFLRTYVHYAAENGRVEILKYAYITGAELDEKAVDGCPIHLACKSGCYKAIEFLTKTRKCNLNRAVRERTPILHLLNSSCFEAIPLLIKYGMNIDNIIVGQWTTLYYVIRTGSYHVVEILLNFGANPNKCPNKNDWSPMHVAAQEHNDKIVDLLFRKGSIIHCLTKTQQTPFAFSLSPSGYEKGNMQYQTAKRIRNLEVEFFARCLILTFALGERIENLDEIVSFSIKKYDEESNLANDKFFE